MDTPLQAPPFTVHSTLLSELHSGSLGGDGQAMEPACALALAANFGSVERWREAFVAMSKAPGGGSGWALLVFQPRDGTLVNQWVAEDTRAIAGGVPILALDMREHACPTDRGAAAAATVDAFMASVDWKPVYARYQAAVVAASDALECAPDAARGALLLDVRRAGVYEKAQTMIAEASWRDPAQVALWSRTLDPAQEVVVYCVYGHEVGRATALRLRAAGLNARFLRGGIDAWQAAGRPVKAKTDKR